MMYILDVVSAYKNLLKEKEALDASIKVLTSTQQASPKPPTKSNRKRTEEISTDGSNQEQKGKEKMPSVSPSTEEKQEKFADGKPVLVDDHPLRENVNDEEAKR